MARRLRTKLHKNEYISLGKLQENAFLTSKEQLS
jgi:hypothetical protein